MATPLRRITFLLARSFIALILLITGLAPRVAAQEATTTESPQGKLLPQFTLKSKNKEVTFSGGGSGGIGSPSRIELAGDVRLLWGDVSLRADRMVFEEGLGRIEATGDIVL
ncbi:MAG: hypothetical protein H7145_22305, partial [Akkermansiaceae bacterium]|nr:hypothetical protein [Armatimonadota bacterium]